MIAGIGIDIVSVNRICRWLKKPEILERYFHPDEISFVKAKSGNTAASLAARFAAKEAFGKALGTGLANITLKDIMVQNKQNGKPELILFNTAKKALENSGAQKVHISLTHEKENAVAVVILEGI
jgi:holo-[acyl-carrier protein] synthase